MTPTFRLIPVLAGVVAIGGIGIAGSGCGGSKSSSSPNDGGPDATLDGSESDAGDAPSTTDADAGTSDATPSLDVSDDGEGDAADAGSADADAGSVDAGSDADAQVAPVYSGTAASFPGAVASTLCARVASCCGTSADAATFDFAACTAAVSPAGFNGSSTGSDLLDGGHIGFNPVAAQACLDAPQSDRLRHESDSDRRRTGGLSELLCGLCGHADHWFGLRCNNRMFADQLLPTCGRRDWRCRRDRTLPRARRGRRCVRGFARNPKRFAGSLLLSLVGQHRSLL